jgi:hypothetical protein
VNKHPPGTTYVARILAERVEPKYGAARLDTDGALPSYYHDHRSIAAEAAEAGQRAAGHGVMRAAFTPPLSTWDKATNMLYSLWRTTSPVRPE